MSELTIVIEDYGDKELKSYLMLLNGIRDVLIDYGKVLKIYIKYDANLISMKVIKMEILLFLNLLKVPSILAFDKHAKEETLVYKIVRKDVCCEYCFRGEIEELFEIPGIEKVESNFNGVYYNEDDSQSDIVIEISYNPKLISLERMKQIELELDL